MKKIKLHLNYAGFCMAKENYAIKNGRDKDVKFNALWGLIDHPEHGLILYDTGYTNRFFEVTRSIPYSIYAKITKVSINQKDEVKTQLVENGINPENVKHLIVTHFHGDHVAGLLDFPNATIYASRYALRQALNVSNIIALSKGILKNLLPHNLEERTKIIEDFRV